MYQDEYTPQSVADAVKKYDGVKRKNAIGKLIKKIHIDNDDVVASYGEDAAVIRQGKTALLLASDGIWNKLMELDPYWSGYCAVLVNIHDIAAMGGRPVAMVDVLSSADDKTTELVSSGMHDAALAFDVPLVGGHLHPDAPYNVIDVAILGVADLDDIIYSDQAEPGDSIIVAIDLHGRVHPNAKMNWDSATTREPELLRSQINVMKTLGDRHLVSAGKDISNPGIIGTLGMLLEASGMGARVDLTSIPCPDLDEIGISFEQWVRMYPGMGFVITANKHDENKICKEFRKVGMACRIVGTVNDSRVLTLTKGDDEADVFNFCKEGVTNI